MCTTWKRGEELHNPSYLSIRLLQRLIIKEIPDRIQPFWRLWSSGRIRRWVRGCIISVFWHVETWRSYLEEDELCRLYYFELFRCFNQECFFGHQHISSMRLSQYSRYWVWSILHSHAQALGTCDITILAETAYNSGVWDLILSLWNELKLVETNCNCCYVMISISFIH